MSKWHTAIFIGILCGGLCLLVINISSPFEKAWETQATHQAIAARNHIRYGPAITKLGHLRAPTGLDAEQVDRYRYYNYPPLLPVKITLFYLIFGDYEATTRLVQIIFALGCSVMIFLIVKRLGGVDAGLISMAFCMFSPLILWHGRIPEYLIPVLFYILGAIYFYILWVESRKVGHFLMIFVFQFLGCLTGWAGYFIAPVLFLHSVIAYKKKGVMMALPLLFNFVCFGIYLAHIWYIGGIEAVKFVGGIFQERVGKGYTYFDLIRTMVMFTPYNIGVVSILLGIYLIVAGVSGRLKVRFFGLIIALLFLGLLWAFVFRQLNCLHGYWCAHAFLPCFSISAGVGIIHLWRAKKWFCYVLCIMAIGGFLSQSLWYVYYRHTQTGWYKLDRVFVKVINKKVPEGVAIATRFKGMEPVYCTYYTNREVFWGIKTLKEARQKGARYYIFSWRELLKEKLGIGLSEGKAKELGVILTKDDEFIKSLNKGGYRIEIIGGFAIVRL